MTVSIKIFFAQVRHVILTQDTLRMNSNQLAIQRIKAQRRAAISARRKVRGKRQLVTTTTRRSVSRVNTLSTNTLTLSGANRIMPENFHTILEVLDTTNTTLGTGGGTTAGAVYTGNGVYDYTTTVGNSDVPGYTALSAFYRNWRVKAVRVDFQASNTSANPVIMQVAMFPLGSTAFPSWTTLRQLSANKWAKEKLLSAKGGNDTAKLSLYVPFAEFIGSTYNTDLDWTGTTNSSGSTAGNPANRLEARVYALSADGTTVVAASALNISVNLTYYVHFFGLAMLP